MKGIHMNKLGAVLELKWRTLFSKNFIVMPVFSIGITWVLTWLYGSMRKGEELPAMMRALALGLGASMNITMTGILCTGMGLAEEKEKNTLRALMTSSVNGLEFFLGSTLPAVVLMLAVNAALIPASGISLAPAGWAAWLGISLLCGIASVVFGMILGICAKNQVAASTLSTVPMLILVMIPSFAGFNATLGRISNFLYTGVLSNAANALVTDAPAADPLGLAVVAAETVLAILIFLYVYGKNGYDRD